MSCSWFLLKPQHEIVKEIKLVGDIIVEIEEENIVAKVDASEFDVVIEDDTNVATVDSTEKSVTVEDDCEVACVTLEKE